MKAGTETDFNTITVNSPLQRGAYFFVVNHFTDISKMINAMHAYA